MSLTLITSSRIFEKKGAILFNKNTMASYRKHYIPLESNPALFTQLIHQLGVFPSLAFQDVLSINDPDLLAFIPRPPLALILVFPTSDAYELAKAKEEEMRDEYDSGGGEQDGEGGEEEPVMWFRQTINNACGLYAILHAISNGQARNHIRKFYYLVWIKKKKRVDKKPLIFKSFSLKNSSQLSPLKSPEFLLPAKNTRPCPCT